MVKARGAQVIATQDGHDYVQEGSAPPGQNDVAAIAAAVEKLLGDKVVAPRSHAMDTPPPPHPAPQGPSALSSFLKSAAVLQQSLPGNDIMSLLHSALGGSGDLEYPGGAPPPPPPPLSARGMHAGIRVPPAPGCSRGALHHSQVQNPPVS